MVLFLYRLHHLSIRTGTQIFHKQFILCIKLGIKRLSLQTQLKQNDENYNFGKQKPCSIRVLDDAHNLWAIRVNFDIVMWVTALNIYHRSPI